VNGTDSRLAVLEAARTVLDSAGLCVEDLASYLAGRTVAARAAGAGTRYPTLAEHIAAVSAAVTSPNTLRTWRTHWQRLAEGVAPQCGCLCDACLDLDAGCGCGCRACADRAGIPAGAGTVLVPGAYTSTALRSYAKVARRLAAKKATLDNRGRARRGLRLKKTDGKGGEENFVTAARRLFQALVDDELWDRNPALRAPKPRRDETHRRSLRDHELVELFRTVVSGGNDPELDLLLVTFHLETGARRQGAIDLRVGDILDGAREIQLVEKGTKAARQPASAELLGMLRDHSISRGGPACDPDGPAYDPTRPVLYYRPGTTGQARPLTSRRYDTLYARIQRNLEWADEAGVTSHSLRKTGASIIERIAGRETARLFLRHGNRSETDTYTQSWQERLAAAFAVFTGEPRPGPGT
jgi:integrase